MQIDSSTLLDAALKLPESEQVALVSQLLDHLSSDDRFWSIDDPGLIEELDRRFADPEGAVPWSELKAEK